MATLGPPTYLVEARYTRSSPLHETDRLHHEFPETKCCVTIIRGFSSVLATGPTFQLAEEAMGVVCGSFGLVLYSPKQTSVRWKGSLGHTFDREAFCEANNEPDLRTRGNNFVIKLKFMGATIAIVGQQSFRVVSKDCDLRIQDLVTALEVATTDPCSRLQDPRIVTLARPANRSSRGTR